MSSSWANVPGGSTRSSHPRPVVTCAASVGLRAPAAWLMPGKASAMKRGDSVSALFSAPTSTLATTPDGAGAPASPAPDARRLNTSSRASGCVGARRCRARRRPPRSSPASTKHAVSQVGTKLPDPAFVPPNSVNGRCVTSLRVQSTSSSCGRSAGASARAMSSRSSASKPWRNSAAAYGPAAVWSAGGASAVPGTGGDAGLSLSK